MPRNQPQDIAAAFAAFEKVNPRHGGGTKSWWSQSLSEEEQAFLLKKHKQGFGPTYLARFLKINGHPDATSARVATFFITKEKPRG